MPGRILVVDDVATNRIVMKVKLAQACHEVLQAGSGAEALRLARAERPDLIVLDVKMPDIDGVTVCKRLKSDPTTAEIPVILITALPDTISKLRGLRHGADDFLSKPVDEMALLARVRSLLRAREEHLDLAGRGARCPAPTLAEAPAPFEAEPRIALIGRNAAEAGVWRRALSPQVAARLSVLSPEDAMRGGAGLTDAFILAADLDRPGDGLGLLSELRSRPATRHAQIMVITGAGRSEQAAMALDLGAGDVMQGPVDPGELAVRVRALISRKRRSDGLRAQLDRGLDLALTDSLTGIRNRFFAMARLPDLLARADGRVAVMMLDVDHFKAVNDRHGHVAGDAVLRALAQRLADRVGPEDILARYGGEEFIVAQAGTDPVAARRAAERLRSAVADRPFPLPGSSEEVDVTLSIGLAFAADADEDVTALVCRADRALYASKSEGRNRLTVSASAA